MWPASWERKATRALPSVVFRITGKMIRHQRKGRGGPLSLQSHRSFYRMDRTLPHAQLHTEHKLMGVFHQKRLRGLKSYPSSSLNYFISVNRVCASILNPECSYLCPKNELMKKRRVFLHTSSEGCKIFESHRNTAQKQRQ